MAAEVLSNIVPEIYEYDDFRTFLSDYVRNARAASDRWSLGVWARHLGLRGTASISMIVNGQRQPGLKISEALAHYFDFGDERRQYFFDLIRLAKSRDDASVPGLKQRIAEARPHRQNRVITDPEFSAIASLTAFSLREMTLLQDFKCSLHWLLNRLRIKTSSDDLVRCRAALVRLGLVKVSEQGSFVTTNEPVYSSDDKSSKALRQLHQQALEYAAEQVDHVPLEEREFRITVFNVARKDLPEIKLAIREQCDKIVRRFESAQGEETYQLSMQFLPLTKSKGKS